MTYNMKTDKRRARLRATALTAKALDLYFLFDFEHAAVDRQRRLARGDLHARVHRTVRVSRPVVKTAEIHERHAAVHLLVQPRYTPP